MLIEFDQPNRWVENLIMQIQTKLRNADKLNYHGIEDYRLYMALENIALGRGFLGFLTPHEMDILDGTLVDNWESGPALTQMGRVFHFELSQRVFKERRRS